MPNQAPTPGPHVEDAFSFIVRYIREGMTGPHAAYGYEVYLPNIMRVYAQSVMQSHEIDAVLPDISPAFYAAAWELCRRGVLRPGIKRWREQATDEGSAGNGYSITPVGRDWFRQAGQYDYIPVEPGRFAQILDGFAPRFGAGFRERAQEAMRSYVGTAYLACCAMCGAAAESIILGLAIAKTGDEGRILKMYESAGGRGRVESLIIGQQPPTVQSEFRSSTNLLKYWRDAAAHGRQSGITDNEAYTSLALLLRFAQYANDRWNALTQLAHPSP